MRKILVLGFIFICGLCFGQENDFHYIGKSNNNAKYYASLYKNDSIRMIKDVWIKCIYPSKTVKNKFGKLIKIKGEISISLQRIFCDDKKVLTLSYIKYNNKGNIIKNNQFSEYGDPEYIIPDSMGESYYNFACKNIIEWDPDVKYE